MSSKPKVYINDLPEEINLAGDIAIDTEAMGLKLNRDRLCLVQICDSDGQVVMIHFPEGKYNYEEAINLKKLLTESSKQKIFHYARFDVAIMCKYLQISSINNIFCTKIASKFSRTYTDHHGLKTIAYELLGVEMKKEQQSSNWGAAELTESQILYAKNDVIYLHKIRSKLKQMLINNGRMDIVLEYFSFLNNICKADIMGFEGDMFSH